MKALEGKVMGVIGGMGPMATDVFYKMVIENTPAKCDQDHINMIILSHATMPDRTAAIKSGNTDVVLEKMTANAKFLEESGAACIAVPCNTSHVILKDVSKSVNIPIINMIEETAEEASKKLQGGAKVGIMATDGTIEIGLYQKALKAKGLEPVILPGDLQSKVMKIIYEGVKEGKPIEQADFEAVSQGFISRGCDCVILGCTELSVCKFYDKLGDYYLDAMECLAKKAIELCK